jgi:hypothetical protein
LFPGRRVMSRSLRCQAKNGKGSNYISPHHEPTQHHKTSPPHTHTRRDTHTHTQRERHTHTERERERHTHTHRESQRSDRPGSGARTWHTSRPCKRTAGNTWRTGTRRKLGSHTFCTPAQRGCAFRVRAACSREPAAPQRPTPWWTCASPPATCPAHTGPSSSSRTSRTALHRHAGEQRLWHSVLLNFRALKSRF